MKTLLKDARELKGLKNKRSSSTFRIDQALISKLKVEAETNQRTSHKLATS
jgi:hypothetical protein